MKTSQNCQAHQRVARKLIAAGAIGLAALLAAPAAQAQTTGTTQQYTPWAGAAGQQMKSLIADLKAKIAAAEQSQAASPDFLADLKALVTKYESMQNSGGGGTAAGTLIFSDNFSDMDYTSKPAWKVSAGTWGVDQGGVNYGLVTKVRPQKLNINNVLGALLNSQTGSTNQNQNEFASIYTPVKIPNAFALKVTLTSKDKQGALNLGAYQGASGSTLYRMVYQPGASPGIAIQKVTSSGATTLGSYNSVVNLEDGKPHTLVFSRDAQGNMKVTLDEKSVTTAKDTSIKGDMAGLLFINSGGAYYIRDVAVMSN